MKLTKIELNNFGSYYGRCEMNIDISDDQKKIVLIGGKNGSGKTTLFTAIELCLYGHYSFGYKNAGKLYTKNVMSYINDRAKLDEDNSACITLSFVDSSNGDLDSYSITRSWTWVKGNVKETLSAIKNGSLLEKRDLVDFQNFLLNLIPPSLLKLYFFDGERIAEYLLDDQKNNVKDALMVLSGNDTFDIMYSGIRKILIAGNAAEDTATREFIQRKSDKLSAEKSIQEIQEDIDSLILQIEEKNADIDRVKNEYAAQGGITLDEWKELNSKLKNQDEIRERINSDRKEIATDILPFVIVSNLVEQVRPQIAKEHEFKTWKTLSKTLKTDRFKKIIKDTLSKTTYDNCDSLVGEIYDNVVKYLVPINGWSNFDPIFGLSEDDELNVQAIINRVAQFDAKQVSKSKKQIDASIAESQRIREKIQNSSIDNYQEYIKNISELKDEAFRMSVILESKQKELQSLKDQFEVIQKRFDEAYKNLELDIKKKSVTNISSKTVLLLEELQERINKKLMHEVKEDTLAALHSLIRKRSFIEDLIIDDQYKVHLLKCQIVEVKDIIKIYNRSGIAGVKRSLQKYAYSSLCQKLDVSEDADADELFERLKSFKAPQVDLQMEISCDSLSKGEKQILVMSLYWAMMRQSKCELPFIIDTPFARIDSDHRNKIVDNFFKKLPGQLFILSTNEEITTKHMQAMTDATSNTFLLEYGEDKCTRIIENKYFEV